MGRLMPKFLYFKYAVWADLCPIFYTLNMPYGQTYGYAKIFILQINHMGRHLPKFLYFKYAVWADLCPNFYTSNIVYVAHCLYYLPFIIYYIVRCYYQCLLRKNVIYTIIDH